MWWRVAAVVFRAVYLTLAAGPGSGGAYAQNQRLGSPLKSPLPRACWRMRLVEEYFAGLPSTAKPRAAICVLMPWQRQTPHDLTRSKAFCGQFLCGALARASRTRSLKCFALERRVSTGSDELVFLSIFNFKGIPSFLLAMAMAPKAPVCSGIFLCQIICWISILSQRCFCRPSAQSTKIRPRLQQVLGDTCGTQPMLSRPGTSRWDGAHISVNDNFHLSFVVWCFLWLDSGVFTTSRDAEESP